MRLLLLIAAALLQQGYTIVLSRYFDFQQTVAIAGQLDCNGSPARGGWVELRDKGEKGEAKRLQTAEPDQNGRFYVFGAKPVAAPKMNPELVIHYQCHSNKEDRRRQTAVIDRMQKYVRRGIERPVPVQLINLGTIKLAEFAKLNRNY